METLNMTYNNLNIRYNEWINDLADPFILTIHGLGGSGYDVIEMAEMLPGYNVISIDLPGHGHSDQLSEDFTMENLISWLHTFTKTLGLKSFYLMAHSYGADVAIHFTKKYPECVQKLMLLDGGYYHKPKQYKLVKQYSEDGHWPNNPITSIEEECAYYKQDFDHYEFKDYETYLESESKAYDRISKPLEFALNALMKEEENCISFAANGDTAIKALKAMYQTPSGDVLSELKVPTLLLVSTKPSHYLMLREALLNEIPKSPNFTYELVDDTTHFLHWDKPEIISKRILEFF